MNYTNNDGNHQYARGYNAYQPNYQPQPYQTRRYEEDDMYSEMSYQQSYQSHPQQYPPSARHDVNQYRGYDNYNPQYNAPAAYNPYHGTIASSQPDHSFLNTPIQPMYNAPRSEGTRSIYSNTSGKSGDQLLNGDTKARKRLSEISIDSDAGGERYCLGLFSTQRGCITVCGSISFILIVGLGVAIFFLFPRQPSFQIGTPRPALNGGNLTFSSSDPIAAFQNASPASPFQASFDLVVDINIFSPNYVDFSLSSIDVAAHLLDPDGSKNAVGCGPNGKQQCAPIGKGSTSRVQFPANKNTTISLPIKIFFNITSPITDIAQDGQMLTLIRACGTTTGLFNGVPPSSTPGKVRIKVEVRLSSKVVSWIGWFPRFDEFISFDCPSATNDLLGMVSRGIGGVNSAVTSATQKAPPGQKAKRTLMF
ncbi:hypothetical protein HDV02_002396 [Globomyces sp. JEL0801]|nr:hypothetical protein HDV02_002396 [Globomyces sp. JEL0801]